MNEKRIYRVWDHASELVPAHLACYDGSTNSEVAALKVLSTIVEKFNGRIAFPEGVEPVQTDFDLTLEQCEQELTLLPEKEDIDSVYALLVTTNNEEEDDSVDLAMKKMGYIYHPSTDKYSSPNNTRRNVLEFRIEQLRREAELDRRAVALVALYTEIYKTTPLDLFTPEVPVE